MAMNQFIESLALFHHFTFIITNTQKKHYEILKHNSTLTYGDGIFCLRWR